MIAICVYMYTYTYTYTYLHYIHYIHYIRYIHYIHYIHYMHRYNCSDECVFYVGLVGNYTTGQARRGRRAAVV